VLEIERLAPFFAGLLVRFAFPNLIRQRAQIDFWNFHANVRLNSLEDLATQSPESGPKRFMPRYDALDGAAERLEIQLSSQPQSGRNVMSPGSGFELFQEP
jgi:hypothetical protein